MIDDKAIDAVLAIFVPQILRHRKKSGKPFILGLSGLQGSGKSTWAMALAKALESRHVIKARIVSLDDLYHDHPDLVAIHRQNPKNKLLQTRGQPGTHDEVLAQGFFRSILQAQDKPEDTFVEWPAFDKSLYSGQGGRVPREQWAKVPLSDGFDVLIFEGWCLGFTPLTDTEVKQRWENDRIAVDGSEKVPEEQHMVRLNLPDTTETDIKIPSSSSRPEAHHSSKSPDSFNNSHLLSDLFETSTIMGFDTKNNTEQKPEENRVEMQSEPLEKGVGIMGEVADYSGAVKKTSAEEIRLVRKLDFRIMPTLWAMYFLNYLDRNAIAQARLNDLEDHLGLVGTQYNTCISILFVGYLLMQIPSNMIISSGRVRPSIYMAVCMMAWAVVSACTALARNYTGLVLLRFFLGVTEAPFYPGALYLLSIFYTRKEIATRLSILYSGNIFATSFSGLIAAATFGTIDGHHGLHGWQWLFIIEGVLTFCVGIIGMFTLADSPLTTRWLTEDERQLAHDRMIRDTVGLQESKGARAGFAQAVRDPRLWLLCFIQNMHLSACSFNNFFPTVVGSLGFNDTITLVLTCPPYLVSGFFGYCAGLSSGKYNERTYHITVCMSIALVGYIISCVTLNTAARYIACFLFASGAYAVNSMILGWVSATLGSTPEKKSVSLSIVNVVANASYIYTAYLYPESDGPRYLIGMSSNAGFAVMCIAGTWVMRTWLVRTNKRLDREGNTDAVRYAY
ncbi:hypothetical protein S40288_03857 [Stachybotrys chartarum IBT 40288]|nr:hypothetical protein S40288_03857 [Stachybotrys chartarum IBT 40288]